MEARLAGVVMAALKEVFDRDSVRLEMERAQIDAERRRAEELLRAELRRQAADRVLGQLRLIAVMAVGMWALSAVLGIWMPGMREGLPRVLLGAGWVVRARRARDPRSSAGSRCLCGWPTRAARAPRPWTMPRRSMRPGCSSPRWR